MFRYWKLESGIVTSSLTVLSDCVFRAVYDVVELQEKTTDTQITTISIQTFEE